MSLLEVRSLVAGYHAGGFKPIVDGVTLRLGAGETLGLIGESGSGKSTLARAIVGVAAVASGSVILDGREERVRRSVAFRRRVQMISQAPGAAFSPRMSVEDILGEALRVAHRADAVQTRPTIPQLLEMVELPRTLLSRWPREMSGGQLQRVAIARALATSPDVIIADEITSALDVSVQGRLLDLLRQIQAEQGIALLFISHALDLVRQLSHRVAILYLGRLAEVGDARAVLDQPRHPYTRILTASALPLSGPWSPPLLLGEPPDPRAPPSGCRFHTRCPQGPLRLPGRRLCIDQVPILNSGASQAACHFAFSEPTR